MAGKNKEHEYSHEEPFDKGRCIEGTIRSFYHEGYSLGLQENEIPLEDRYLAEEMLPASSQRSHAVLLTSVAERLQEHKAALLERSTSLSLEDASAIIDRANEVARGTASRLISRATELGLVADLNSEETEARHYRSWNRPLYTDVSHPYGEFSRKGWAMMPTKDGGFMLVQPQEYQEERTRFTVVDIDTLYQQDPEAVKKAIRDYHEANEVARLANEISYNVVLHEIDALEVVPSVVRTLGTEVPRQERKTEIALLGIALTYFDMLGDPYAGLVHRFSYNYGRKRAALPDNSDRDTITKVFLDHMKGCEGIPADTRVMYEQMQDIYDHIHSFVQHGPIEEQESLAGEGRIEWDIMRDPLRFMEDSIRSNEKVVREELAVSREVQRFIIAAQQLSRQEAETLLARDFPEFHNSLEGLKQHVRASDSPFGAKSYDQLMNKVDNSFIVVERLNKQELRQLIEDQLLECFPMKLTDGKPARNPGWEAYLSDRGLQEVLCVLAVKCIEKKRSKSLPRLQKELLEEQEQSIQSREEWLERKRLEKMESRRFLFEQEISPKEIEGMMSLASATYRDGEAYTEPIIFSAMFNMLYLSRIGLARVDSPVLRVLMEEVFPHSQNPDMWKQFQQMIRDIEASGDPFNANLQ